MVSELVRGDAPDVVPVRAELEQVARSGVRGGGMLERAPLVVKPACVIDAAEEECDADREGGDEDPKRSDTRGAHRARAGLEAPVGERVDEPGGRAGGSH